MIAYECDLSGNTAGNVGGCKTIPGGGTPETTKIAVIGNGTCASGSFCGTRSDNGAGAIVPIDAWNICRWVDNATANSIFLPFRSSAEWKAFLQNAPTGIDLVHCAEPYAETGAAASAPVTPPYANCTTATVSTPDAYGRTGVSLWPDPAVSQNFICHSGATAITSLLQWIAGDADTLPPSELLSWNPKNIFSPDLTLLATDTSKPTNAGLSVSITEGTPVVLSWTTGPSYADQTWTCTASGSWSGVKAPNGGSEQVTPAVGPNIYTLACTDGQNLTSTTSVSVDGQQACIPTGQPVPQGQTQCPTQSCFLQVSGGIFVTPNLADGLVYSELGTSISAHQGSCEADANGNVILDNMVGAGDYALSAPSNLLFNVEPGGACPNYPIYDPATLAAYPLIRASYFTFDGVALGSTTHVTIYSGPNYIGNVLFDQHGPYLLESNHYATFVGIDLSDWSGWGPTYQAFPPSTRHIDETGDGSLFGVDGMRSWGRGTSLKVTCDP